MTWLTAGIRQSIASAVLSTPPGPCRQMSSSVMSPFVQALIADTSLSCAAEIFPASVASSVVHVAGLATTLPVKMLSRHLMTPL